MSLEKNNQIRLILEGKQLGVRFSFMENERTIWSSVGVQLHDEKYKVYADEIEESKMAAESYRMEVGISFTNVSDALNWIRENTRANPDELRPCKGLKIFNPALFD